jgi:hypothetical protein
VQVKLQLLHVEQSSVHFDTSALHAIDDLCDQSMMHIELLSQVKSTVETTAAKQLLEPYTLVVKSLSSLALAYRQELLPKLLAYLMQQSKEKLTPALEALASCHTEANHAVKALHQPQHSADPKEHIAALQARYQRHLGHDDVWHLVVSECSQRCRRVIPLCFSLSINSLRKAKKLVVLRSIAIVINGRQALLAALNTTHDMSQFSFAWADILPVFAHQQQPNCEAMLLAKRIQVFSMLR